MFSKYKDFVPKSIFCLREGYSWNYFYNDLFAGISVGPSRHVNRKSAKIIPKFDEPSFCRHPLS